VSIAANAEAATILRMTDSLFRRLRRTARRLATRACYATSVIL
jgi:hypothetical protein